METDLTDSTNDETVVMAVGSLTDPADSGTDLVQTTRHQTDSTVLTNYGHSGLLFQTEWYAITTTVLISVHLELATSVAPVMPEL